MEQETYVYWERQGAGRLCGVHCINALLQGPFYDHAALESIALDLDMKQQHLLQGLQAPSGNVDHDGNYSVQVLIQALKKIGEGLVIEPVHTLQNLDNVSAYLCHSDAHWFGLRKVRGTWFNLNSTLGDMPQLVTYAELEKFIKKNKKNSQCKVFAVIGNSLPTPIRTDFKHYMPHQRWISESAIRHHHEEIVNSDNAGLHGLYIYGITEAELLNILKQQFLYDPAMPAAKGIDQDELIAQAIKFDHDMHAAPLQCKPIQSNSDSAASLLAGATSSMPKAATNSGPLKYDKLDLLSLNSDPDLFLITKESIEDLFKDEPKAGVRVAFHFHNNQIEKRIFSEKDKVESLYDYVFLKVSSNYPQGLYKYLLLAEGQELRDMSTPLSIIVPEDYNHFLPIQVKPLP